MPPSEPPLHSPLPSLPRPSAPPPAAHHLTLHDVPSAPQELGGSEKRRIKEQLYPNDFECSAKGRIALAMPPQRLVFELWHEVAPLAVENFVGIVCGDKGKGSESGVLISYVGCAFHRIIKGFVAQGGDFVKNNGSGGEAIWGKKFKDDPAGLKVSRTPLLLPLTSGLCLAASFSFFH